MKSSVIVFPGSNCDRDMDVALKKFGFKNRMIWHNDEEIPKCDLIVLPGGFSYGDYLRCGSIAGKSRIIKSVVEFSKKGGLILGICNGAQLWMELDLINPDHKVHGKLVHNDSKKHESSFTSVKIQENNSVMLSSLAGSELGVWISHGEGKFNLPESEANYNIVGKYGYEGYPNNPNGSDYNTAMLCDSTGRHLVTMPHIERSTFQWNWANYPANRKDEVSPWLEAFVNARKWIANVK